jgi:hypothetical protein
MYAAFGNPQIRLICFHHMWFMQAVAIKAVVIEVLGCTNPGRHSDEILYGGV